MWAEHLEWCERQAEHVAQIATIESARAIRDFYSFSSPVPF